MEGAPRHCHALHDSIIAGPLVESPFGVTELTANELKASTKAPCGASSVPDLPAVMDPEH